MRARIEQIVVDLVDVFWYFIDIADVIYIGFVNFAITNWDLILSALLIGAVFCVG